MRRRSFTTKLGKKPTGKVCKAMKGLIEEGETDKKLTALAEDVINLEAAGQVWS